MKVYINRKLPLIAEQLLKKNKISYEVFQHDRPITKKELIKAAADCDAVISLLTDKIDREVIDSLPNCKIIANYAVGYNNIDAAYAKSKRIIVTNTPDVLTQSTADLTLALILACARRFGESQSYLLEGRYTTWKPMTLLGMELQNKTAGIIGGGRIGTETAKRLKAFGVKIIYFDRTRKAILEKLAGAKKVSLNNLLKKSDIVSVHLPLTSETHHLLDYEKLSMLKSTAILVNTARGEIIEEAGLIRILKEKKIFAAGLDVFEGEPNLNRNLLKFPNLLVLPHIGSATVEARSGMAELAARNVIDVLRGKKPISPV